jgi:hypothetical protein
MIKVGVSLKDEGFFARVWNAKDLEKEISVLEASLSDNCDQLLLATLRVHSRIFRKHETDYRDMKMGTDLHQDVRAVWRSRLLDSVLSHSDFLGLLFDSLKRVILMTLSYWKFKASGVILNGG